MHVLTKGRDGLKRQGVAVAGDLTTRQQSIIKQYRNDGIRSGDFVQSFKVFPCIESNHLPVGIVPKMHTASSVNSGPRWINKLIWDKTKETDFLAVLFLVSYETCMHVQWC